MNLMEFRQEFTKLRRGDWMIYHSGLLMRDRIYDAGVEMIAREAWLLHQQGRASLVQHRVAPLDGPSRCNYMAVKL